MTTYNFDHTPDRRGLDCAKWGYYAPDVIPLWVADMDFRPPQPVLDALHDQIDTVGLGYPLADGNDDLTRLRALLVERMQHLYHWQIKPQDIVFVPGVVTAFHMASYACVEPNGAILVQPPVYPPIWHAARTTGVLAQEAPLVQLPGGNYAVDWECFEGAITPETRLFLLCNPHNPVGRVFTRPELEKFAEICLRHNVLICSDEIHADLIYSGHSHIPIASLAPEIAERTITLMAPSKTFNMAGLQCSFAIIPNAELRKQFQRSNKGLASWVNTLGLVAAQAAYAEGQEWLDQVLVYLQGNRDFLARFVQERLPGIHMVKAEGTYLAWLDCRELALPGGPYAFFLEKARVALNDGQTFGPGGEGFVRLNFACTRATLEQALLQIQQAVAGTFDQAAS
ncbi:MAG TPA: PatB family C-S lyase [Anaerolineales bacterium]|nr:PatB family C-S lyase [Anaerolineales bacterium]